MQFSGVTAPLPGTTCGSGTVPTRASVPDHTTKAEVTTAWGNRTSTPADIAAGVVKPIAHSRGEIDVAPAEVPLRASLGSLFPSINDAAQRQAGAAEMVSKHAYND